MRPVLKPALRRLWRDPSTLQLGITPEHAVVLDGIDLADTDLIDLIDGSRDRDELATEAARLGHPPQRMHDLLATLASAGALDEAAGGLGRVEPRRQPDLLALSLLHRAPGAGARVLAAREAASVEVIGAGRVGATLAMLLASAGVGDVHPVDNGPVRQADLAPGGIRTLGSRQPSRAEAVGALVGALHPASRSRYARPAPNSGAVVVLAPTGSVVPPEWLAQVRHRPHLPVTVRETSALIGPLVVPGRTPCLRCVELSRGDRDPTWPVLAAQLVGDRHTVEPCDVVLATAAAALAALHVLGWLDRGLDPPPPSVGGILELSLGDLRLRRRTVTAHPGCGCGAADEPSLD